MTVYTTSFSEYTDDTQLSDWTAQWASDGSEWLKRSGISEYDNAYLEFSESSYGKYALSWDDAGSAVTDVDIVVVFKPSYDAVYGNSTQMILARGGGTGAAPTGYLVTLSNGYYRVAKYYNTIMQNLDTNPAVQAPTLSTSTWYALRFQISGTDIKARYWEVGSTEPGTWDLEGIDNDYTSGWCGVGAETPVDIYFDLMSIGTNGDAGELPPDLSGELDVTLPEIKTRQYETTAFYANDAVGIGILSDLRTVANVTAAGMYITSSSILPALQSTASVGIVQGMSTKNLILPELRITAEFDERGDLNANLPVLQLEAAFGYEAYNLILPDLRITTAVSETPVIDIVTCTASCLLPPLTIEAYEQSLFLTADINLPPIQIQASLSKVYSITSNKILPELRIVSSGYCNTLVLNSNLPTLIMRPIGYGDNYSGSYSTININSRFDNILLRYSRWTI